MSFLKKPANILSSIRENLFLRKHLPMPATLHLLKTLYPSVNWARVDFYEGLPWFTPIVAPYVTAQALPNFYSFGRFRIYLKKFDETRAQCVADIVHEGFHIMQGMNYWKGYGLGFLRGLMVVYNALFLKFGYRQNPIEIPAYDQEFKFLQYCVKKNLHGVTPRLKPGDLEKIGEESALVFTRYTPKPRVNVIAWMAAFIFCLVVATLKPVADLAVYFIRLFLIKAR